MYVKALNLSPCPDERLKIKTKFDIRDTSILTFLLTYYAVLPYADYVTDYY